MKPDLQRFEEVITAVEFRTMDAVIHVNVAEDSLGEISIVPPAGHLMPVVEEIIFNPLNGNDCQILQFLAEHAAHWYAKVEAEREAEQLQKKPAAIVAGEGMTVSEQLKEWALK